MPMRNRKTFPVITVYLREIQTHFARTDRCGTHAFDIISIKINMHLTPLFK